MSGKRFTARLGLISVMVAAGPFLVACQTMSGGSQGAEGASAAAQTKALNSPVPVLATNSKNQAVIAYFGAPDSENEGNMLLTEQVGGFYRVYSGKNNAGQHLVQDFYQTTGTQQSSLFSLDSPDKLLEWGATPAEGDLMFYRPTGQVRSASTYRNGRLNGRDVYYNDDGSERSVFTWTDEVLQGPFFAREPGTSRFVEGSATAGEIVNIMGVDGNGNTVTGEDATVLLDDMLNNWYVDLYK